MLGLTFGLHYFLWARLVRDAQLGAATTSALTVLLFLLGASVPTTLVLQRSLPRRAAAPLAGLTFRWLGAFFFLVVLLLPGELVRLALWLGAALGMPLGASTWLGVQRALAGGAALGALGLTLSGLRSAGSGPALERVRIELHRWPGALAGLRVVQLTDVHVGPTLGEAYVRELVARVNALDPDLVVLTGDLVDGTVAELGPHVAPLQGLRSRLGTFFVTGNHEYYAGVEPWVRELRRLGLTVLRNEGVRLERDGAAFLLAGVEDLTSHSGEGAHAAAVARALSGRAEGEPVVLLAHQPKQVHDAKAHGVDLQLSGHTHGGQLFPWHYLVRAQQGFVAGLHRVGDTLLYVSRGSAWWGPPMRVGAPSELTLLELFPALG